MKTRVRVFSREIIVGISFQFSLVRATSMQFLHFVLCTRIYMLFSFSKSSKKLKMSCHTSHVGVRVWLSSQKCQSQCLFKANWTCHLPTCFSRNLVHKLSVPFKHFLIHTQFHPKKGILKFPAILLSAFKLSKP